MSKILREMALKYLTSGCASNIWKATLTLPLRQLFDAQITHNGWSWRFKEDLDESKQAYEVEVTQFGEQFKQILT